MGNEYLCLFCDAKKTIPLAKAEWFNGFTFFPAASRARPESKKRLYQASLQCGEANTMSRQSGSQPRL